ncbi:MAG TPA: hypothetical protein VF329_05060 [Gammaproteobacteria bacterium]
MREDGLGEWNEEVIDGAHVEWRRRKAQADEARFGTKFVVDISMDGSSPVIQGDFNPGVDRRAELELRVRLLMSA